MLGYAITFFILAIIASIFGFFGLAGTLTVIAKFLAVLFAVLFVSSLLYSAVTGRRVNPPI